MSGVSSIGLKNPDWDISKGKFEFTDSLPLMSSPGPIFCILGAYLLFVLKIGPAYMQKREGFKLKYPLLVYNVAQVVLSAFMVLVYYNHMKKYGFINKSCLLAQDPTRSEVIKLIYIYFAAKVTELLDTIFFVIRKKNNQVTFLHVYHHSVMMIGTWAYLKYAPSDNVVFIGFMNSLVHVFMYSYYGLASLGPGVAKYLWWKKYMTSFQLIQFLSILVQYFVSLFVSDCPPSRTVYSFFILNIFTFIVLFLNFYKKSYAKAGHSKRNGVANGIANGITNGIVKEIKMNGDAFKAKVL